MSQLAINDVVDQLHCLDTCDLASGVGALQLLPENADHLLRLEYLADRVVSLAKMEKREKLAHEHWERLVNHSPVADASFLEDPFDSLFTETLTFHGGCHLVLPGLAEEGTFILRQMLVALFLGEPAVGNCALRESARKIVQSVLILSNEIARSAGLSRGIPPSSAPGGDCVVPDACRFETLKRAVTFSDGELAALLRRCGATPHDLTPLVHNPDRSSPPREAPESSVASQPILRIGDYWIVISPTCLLSALRHALISMAVREGYQDPLAAKYRTAVFFSVDESLRRLGITCQGARGLTDSKSRISEGLYRFDTDKVLRVAVITDPLVEYKSEVAFGNWPNDGVMNGVNASLLQAEEGLFVRTKGLNEILDLVIVQGVGRSMAFGLEGPLGPVRSRRLVMSAAELEIIPLLPDVNSLTLWQFAQASDAIRDHTKVFAIGGTLDEFALYRRYRSSYYVSDGLRPDFLQVIPGMALDLRVEAFNRSDFHSVRYPGTNRLVEIVLFNPDRAIPIYMPLPRSDVRISQLIEGLPLLVWVLAPEEFPAPEYRKIYVHFVEMIAYWVWQLKEGLAPLLQAAADYVDHFEIEIELIPGQGWLNNDSREEADGTLGCYTVTPEILRLQIGPGIVPALGTPDNSGERDIIRTLLGGLQNWGERSGVLQLASLSDEAITELLDRFVPLGRKKKLLFLPNNTNPSLIEDGLPRAREIQAFDAQQVLDDIGRFCTEKLRLPQGTIPKQDRTVILKEVVEHIYCELERLIATLSPKRLLECLVGLNEALVYRQEFRRLTMPTQIACFGSVTKMAERLQRELPEAATAAIASRFLIEYVTARPPSGLRPFSFGIYDRLLALAGQIIGIANVSDAIHYNLSDPPCALLPSGRLALGRGELEVALDAYMGIYALGEIGRTADHFEKHWRTLGATSPPTDTQAIVKRMNEASAAEFGHPLNDFLKFLGEVVHLGQEIEGEAKVIPLSQLADTVAKALKWEEAKTNDVLDWFTLRPRPQFLVPPTGFAKPEVYPWRFNRALSYIRRPLLIRNRKGVDEVVWGIRHVHEAIDYLINLCLGGRLKAQSQAMRRLMGDIHARDGEKFNALVAEIYRQRPELLVRAPVKKIGGKRIARPSGEDLGDIDVLVADPEHFLIHAVETKDFSAALSAAELSNELAELFGSADGKPGAVQRHLERVRWLQDNLSTSLEWLGLPSNELDKWRVNPVVVLERELVSPFLAQHSIQIVSLRELREQFGYADSTS